LFPLIRNLFSDSHYYYSSNFGNGKNLNFFSNLRFLIKRLKVFILLIKVLFLFESILL